MSTIRRQSIISSGVVYFGFMLGLVNTYLFTRQGGFTKAEYGLTGTFIAFANIMFSVASLGMPAYITKFFPYYSGRLPARKNDQFTWAFTITLLGFFFVLLFGIFFKDILIDRMFNNSPELVRFYYWSFPFGFGFTLFSLLEAFAWQHRASVLTNFLKEVGFRALTTILIVLTTIHFISDISVFIGLYAFLYLIIALYLLIYFIRKGQIHFTFSVSTVTKRFYNKIVLLASFVWGGGIVFNVANVFDTIVIAAILPDGMSAVAPFLLAQNISSLVQAPQRAVVSSAVGPLAKAWKEKDLAKIRNIYNRSSINQLMFASAMFCLIWLNFEDGIATFRLQQDYLSAKWVFFFIGMYRIIDMGTGLNAQIIGTSTFWRFEFLSGMLLLVIMLPLNWLLTQRMGIIGPAISNLIGFSIYNFIRFVFLYRKFRMQPFTIKTLLAIANAFAAYLICRWLFDAFSGFGWIVVRSFTFCLLFGTGAVLLKLSPDLRPVTETLLRKSGLRR